MHQFHSQISLPPLAKGGIEGGCKIIVSGTSYLAGSWAFTDLCVGNVLRMTDLTLADAIDMAGARPRALLGLPERRLEVGQPAELVLFDWEPGGDFQVRETLV